MCCFHPCFQNACVYPLISNISNMPPGSGRSFGYNPPRQKMGNWKFHDVILNPLLGAVKENSFEKAFWIIERSTENPGTLVHNIISSCNRDGRRSGICIDIVKLLLIKGANPEALAILNGNVGISNLLQRARERFIWDQYSEFLDQLKEELTQKYPEIYLATTLSWCHL